MPVVFALIFLLGTVGNGLVLAVLLQPGPSAWQEPGSTTDLFILNLAAADLCFILCCVPFQAAIYSERFAELHGEEEREEKDRDDQEEKLLLLLSHFSRV